MTHESRNFQFLPIFFYIPAWKPPADFDRMPSQQQTVIFDVLCQGQAAASFIAPLQRNKTHSLVKNPADSWQFILIHEFVPGASLRGIRTTAKQNPGLKSCLGHSDCLPGGICNRFSQKDEPKEVFRGTKHCTKFGLWAQSASRQPCIYLRGF